MGFKCTPQIIGLNRDGPKPGKRGGKQKHRAAGKAILSEAGKERHSASETLDRTRSHLNTYEGVSDSGFAVWDAIRKEADAYRLPVKLRDGKMAERGLRQDAVIGWAVIFNPPMEMVEGWSRDDYTRFFTDAWEVMKTIEPRLFRDENVRLRATHRDEGYIVDPGAFDDHQHIIGMSRDEEGKFCGNIIDAKFLIQVNKLFPQMMRDRGWDLDDLDMTDWDRMKTDPEYRAERQKRKSGRSVNDFIRDKLKTQLQETIQVEDEIKLYYAQTMKNKEATKEAKEKAQKALKEAQEMAAAIITDAQQAAQEAARERQAVLEQARILREGLDALETEMEGLETPPGLAEYAKTYTRKQFKKGKYNVIKQAFEKVYDENGEPIREIHNCYQDWTNEVQARKRRADDAARRFEDIIKNAPEGWDLDKPKAGQP